MDYIKEVEKRLDLSPTVKKQVMCEVESHFNDLVDELQATGLDINEASKQAAIRLGDPCEFSHQMQAAYGHASWKGALLTALPFLGWFLLTGWWSLRSIDIADWTHPMLVVFALGLLVVCARELYLGRRPVWLPTWFGVGLMMCSLLIFTSGASGHGRSDLILFSPTILALLAIIVPVVLSIKLFIHGPYGSAAPASLFLFAFYTSLLVLSEPNSNSGSPISNDYQLLIVQDISIVFLMIFAFCTALSANIFNKGALLITGILVTFIISFFALPAWNGTLLVRNLQDILEIVGFCTIYTILMFIWIILIPLMVARFRRTRYPLSVR